MAKKRKRVSKKRGAPRKTQKKVSVKREKEEMDRAQVWSVDVLLAVVIFVAVILIFYTTMTARQGPKTKDLQAEAESLKVELEQNHEVGFIVDDEIDETKLIAFINNDTDNYTLLKQKLGIKGDICLFFEDTDGNVVILNTPDGNKTGIGNSNIIIGGQPCGVPI